MIEADGRRNSENDVEEDDDDRHQHDAVAKDCNDAC